ncbi:hypothetical protein D3C81_2104380 [compost metagenome]
MAHIVFGGWGKNRLRQLLILAQPLRQLAAVDLAGGLVLAPAAPGDITADDAFDVDALGFFGHHDPVLQ